MPQGGQDEDIRIELRARKRHLNAQNQRLWRVKSFYFRLGTDKTREREQIDLSFHFSVQLLHASGHKKATETKNGSPKRIDGGTF